MEGQNRLVWRGGGQGTHFWGHLHKGVVMRTVAALLFLACISSCTGCATIMGGARDQQVNITSKPAGASVIVNGEHRGTTPLRVSLDRHVNHSIEVSNGAETYTKELGPGFNWMFMGNVLFGGVIGMVVDLSTGAT